MFKLRMDETASLAKTGLFRARDQRTMEVASLKEHHRFEKPVILWGHLVEIPRRSEQGVQEITKKGCH